MNRKISIITVNYNGLSDTCALIDSIPFDETMEVIVVDNASKNDEGSTIQTRYPQVRVIQSSENLGFAGGNNLGIKATTARLQGGAEGHVRGDDKIQVKVGCLVFLDYRLDTFEAAHDANLVEVRHDGRRAMGENRLGKRTNRQVRALWVNVPIDKAGRNVCTLGINNRGALSDGIVDIANGGNGLIQTPFSATVTNNAMAKNCQATLFGGAGQRDFETAPRESKS